MTPYLHRLVDDRLRGLLQNVPAVAIEGPRACGKTTTAVRQAATVYRLDDERDRALVAADRSSITTADRPVLIDEWQRLPETWDLVRRAADDGAAPGSFVLTGSVEPSDGPVHSGAGRIVTLDMRPLSLAERQVEAPTVSLAQLVAGELPPITGRTDRTLGDEIREALRSGFPGVWAAPSEARAELLDGYVQAILQHDLELAGRQVRNLAALRRWLVAYAAATATTASYEAVRDAASGGDVDAPARSTVIPLRDALERLRIVDPLPGWLPTRNVLRRLTESPKHHLVDVALAARLVGLDGDALLRPGPDRASDPSLLGRLFESHVVGSIRSMAAVGGVRCFHLRTRGGDHEIDLVLERPDGRVLAVEVKMAEAVDDRDVRHLAWLRAQLGADLVDAVVISTGQVAHRRADGIAVLPLALLGP